MGICYWMFPSSYVCYHAWSCMRMWGKTLQEVRERCQIWTKLPELFGKTFTLAVNLKIWYRNYSFWIWIVWKHSTVEMKTQNAWQSKQHGLVGLGKLWNIKQYSCIWFLLSVSFPSKLLEMARNVVVVIVESTVRVSQNWSALWLYWKATVLEHFQEKG